MNNIEKNVKKMYETYEYPKYDENWDMNAPYPGRFNVGCHPNVINHYIYNGKRKTFNNYSALFVGCGLGDDVITFCFNFKKYNNLKIVCIDLSTKSLEILKLRLKKYNFNNVKIVNMSLLDLTPEMFGKFDMINCIGVLHHIENPPLGLKILNNLLKDDGCMDIMLYGKYGRTGVYAMRNILKIINKKVHINDYSTKINNFKKIYSNLPNTNLFKFNEQGLSDHMKSDNGIVDMLLHHQDRAYTIPELYEYFDEENLNIVSFDILDRFKLNVELIDYNFDSDKDKYAFNEILFSDISKHSCFVTKNKNTIATFENLDNIIVPYLLPISELKNLVEHCKKLIGSFEDPDIIYSNNYLFEFEKYKTIKPQNDYIKFPKKYKIIFETNYIITSMLDKINGKRTIKQIINLVKLELKINNSENELISMFKKIFKIFEMHDLLLLSENNL